MQEDYSFSPFSKYYPDPYQENPEKLGNPKNQPAENQPGQPTENQPLGNPTGQFAPNRPSEDPKNQPKKDIEPFPPPFILEQKASPGPVNVESQEDWESVEVPETEEEENYTNGGKKFAAVVGVVIVVLILFSLSLTFKDKNIVPPVIDGLILADKGGKIVSSDGVEIIVPPGALNKDEKLEVVKAGTGKVTDLFHLKPDGIQFLKPVTVAVPYKETGLATGETPYDISLKYFREGIKQADKMPFMVDEQEKKLRTEVMEF